MPTEKPSVSKMIFNGVVPNYSRMADSVDLLFKLNQGLANDAEKVEHSVSSGMLMCDLILGNGGVVPGAWYTGFGAEQSAKSTLMSYLMCSSALSEIPIIEFWDFEKSTDPSYINSILKSVRFSLNRRNGIADVRTLFGTRDIDGNHLLDPKVRYYDEVLGVKFFDSVSFLLSSLPDKVYVDKTWFLVYERTQQNISELAGKYNKNLLQKTGKFYIEAPDGGRMQAMFFVDSYPAMLAADDIEVSQAMALEARMFAKHVKRVKARLRMKGASVWGINQLRQNPGVSYGSPEYEPCGSAIKLFSDCRLRQAERSVPHATGKSEEEPSVENKNGMDKYRYVVFKTQKNKLAVPSLEGWFRLWVTDVAGNARGFCPVYDTFQYLKNTGQCTGTIKSLSLTTELCPSTKKLSWGQFKSLILLSPKRRKKQAVLKHLGLSEDIRLRDQCFKQIKNGKGISLYFNNLKKTV